MGILNFESHAASGEKFLLSKLRPLLRDGVVVDVGANVGNYSQRVLQDSSGSLTIFAFEPHPKNFAKLVERIHDKRFHPINAAVGKEESVLELYDHAGTDGSTEASLYKEVIEDLHNDSSVAREVRVLSLDDFAKESNVRQIDLLKIDTEGNEYAVLEGAKDLIDRGAIKVIQFEFNVMNVVSRTFLRDFKRLLCDYKFYRLLPNEFLNIDGFSPLYDEIFAYQNIVAIHKHSVIEVVGC